MNNMLIEMLGLSKLKQALLFTQHLDPCIPDHNTEPCWDGNVFVYTDKGMSKSALRGKVPVQVKCTCRYGIPQSLSYDIELDDLRAYYRDGGVVFFVICLNEDGTKHKIFYKVLLPFDLYHIVNLKQKKKRFQMELFPEGDQNEIMNVFGLFLDNWPKQAPIISDGLQSIEDMCKRGVVFESFSIYVPNYGGRVPYDPAFLSHRTYYVYAKAMGVSGEIPIQKIDNSIVSTTIYQPVMVNDIEYYPSYMLSGENKEYTVVIGQSFTLKTVWVDETKGSAKFNFKIKGTLKQRICDLSFFAAILSTRKFSISGHEFSLNNADSEDQKEIEGMLKYYNRIQSMLDALGVNEDLVCDGISKQDEQNINNFISAVLYGQHIGIGGLTEELTYGLFSISNLRILILCRKDDQGYYSVDKFSPALKARFTLKDEVDGIKQIDVPAYLRWQIEHYRDANNIDYNGIYDAIVAQPASDVYLSIVNEAALDMLTAYDQQTKKDQKLLLLICNIFEWMMNTAPTDNEAYTLNYLQTLRRQRDLSIDEVGVVYSILAQPSLDDVTAIGARIILKDYERARELISKLPCDESTQRFLKMPIMTLMPNNPKTE